MSVYLKDSLVLLDGSGSVATSADCCCVTGACCVDSVCSVETETDCTGMGGTYQGDDTVCDPNPCPQPCNSCGYPGFLGTGNKYLTQTTEYLWDQTRGAPFGPCTSHFDHITTDTCDPNFGGVTETCAGGGSHTGDFDPDYTWTWEYSSILGTCHCEGVEGCHPCSVGLCPTCTSGDTIVSDTVKYCTCHTTDPFAADLTFTTTLSNPCIP